MILKNLKYKPLNLTFDVEVTGEYKVEGCFNPHIAVSDIDYYGFRETYFDILRVETETGYFFSDKEINDLYDTNHYDLEFIVQEAIDNLTGDYHGE